MYDKPDPKSWDRLEMFAVGVLSDQNMFKAVATEMVGSWPIAAMVNLTNTASNRRAWIGQAACSLAYQVPEIITKSAWKTLDVNTQSAANKTADEIIHDYEAAHSGLCDKVGNQRVFHWDS